MWRSSPGICFLHPSVHTTKIHGHDSHVKDKVYIFFGKEIQSCFFRLRHYLLHIPPPIPIEGRKVGYPHHLVDGEIFPLSFIVSKILYVKFA